MISTSFGDIQLTKLLDRTAEILQGLLAYNTVSISFRTKTSILFLFSSNKSGAPDGNVKYCQCLIFIWDLHLVIFEYLTSLGDSHFFGYFLTSYCYHYLLSTVLAQSPFSRAACYSSVAQVSFCLQATNWRTARRPSIGKTVLCWRRSLAIFFCFDCSHVFVFSLYESPTRVLTSIFMQDN